MELKQLHYFMAICEELHFTRAADKMGVSAPNISQQIRRLEEELGVLLFDRVGKTIVLTEAGAILQEHGAAVFGHLKQANDAIADLKQMQGGSLSIGILPGDADLLFNALLLSFHQTYPTITLSLMETTRVTEQILDRSIDVGVTIGPISDERLTAIPLFHEEFSLAVSRNDPFADEDFMPLSRLNDLKMVMFPPDHQCRKLIDRFCMEKGFTLQPHMVTTTLSSLLQMVQSGIGASVLPRLLLDTLPNKEIKVVSLRQPTPSQDICLIYRSDRYVGYAMRTFIKTLRAYVEAVIQQAKSS
ncbi:LysR family transcriptional regulator [Paenibacillus sp. CGMCC 1.16610]|uniref:LysR family transcriptional regulator n=1 Tax=Paenibacillus anseongense TaxID=2682845 RepID=A0ABW9UDE9_9BACL|nr:MULTISPECIES: LysR family transcriptional regulator [Paenibacillus]MBA2938252.1 LysR family transcriptional regulator [Paenibacillus sp. CGMCC 1.16610]MVQ37310.1 LysR family transcriptional regulator [Paenibacillus anseongense]